jgi:hypothetical protein|tara:strand:+ start:451 stop:750 length:300 start_codon:yes stop_codon:yes gene_type:complete
MADLHKAVRAIHSNVVIINGNTQEDIVAKDKDGNNVTINWTQVNAWTDPNEYKYKRASEYKELKEQFDLLYHDMTAGKGDSTGEWYKHIKAVKDANPKG